MNLVESELQAKTRAVYLLIFFIFHLFILLYIYLIRLYYYRATFKHLETNEFYVPLNTLLTEKV